MQFLLLTVGLALVCGLQAQEEPPENLEELSGIWYTAALASNNSALIEPGGHFRVFVNSLSTSDGNLNGQMLIPQEDGCEKVSLTVYKTETNNKFKLEFWGHDDFYLKEAQPQQYLVLYIINHNNDETNLVANLLVRDPSTQQDFLQTFESACEDLGLRQDQILVVNAGGEAYYSPTPSGPLGSDEVLPVDSASGPHTGQLPGQHMETTKQRFTKEKPE
ncbi:minor allergen Can f 2-like [Ursus americanus]|uniref:minor allergen Can f 2-like n=1 Tax=Ursus americanus TaxID=9643 RepID=UPI001E679623|nr:minor allergen Can f 2-like [Ursus americanus]